MAKGIDIPIQNRNAGNIVSENPIISSFISACISQCGTFFKPGMSLTKSMKNMVRARNTSTAATVVMLSFSFSIGYLLTFIS